MAYKLLSNNADFLSLVLLVSGGHNMLVYTIDVGKH